MTSIFDPTLVVWAGLTVPPALLAVTAWIGYRRSENTPMRETPSQIGRGTPIIFASRRRDSAAERALLERRAA